MITNIFDRQIIIDNEESLRKLIQVVNSEPSNKPLSQHPFSDKDRNMSKLLLKQCLTRSEW